jgi:hypothetical protein
VIVPSEGRYGVNAGASRQAVKERACLGINDAEDRIGTAAGGVEAIVAGVVPNFIGAVCLLNGGYHFAIQRVQNEQRLPTPATHEQVLGWTESET